MERAAQSTFLRQQLVLCMVLMTVILLIISNASASASASSSSSSSQEGVAAYWAEKLHDVPMPPMLSAMVTPLQANDARVLISKIRLNPLRTGYFPSNAPAFCKTTRIVCDRKSYIPTLSCSYQHNYGAFNLKTEQLGPGGFFRVKQTLVKGSRIQLNINKFDKDDGRYDQPRAFLPRSLVQLFPFTKQGLPQLARMLGISKEALPSMQETVSECFSPRGGLPGEILSCPTSLEAMADFVASTMGSQKPMAVLDVSHSLHAGTQDSVAAAKTQTVLDVKTIKGDLNDKYVTCHDMFFPFRVFYCHYLPQTKLFIATLQASDGSIHSCCVPL